MELQEYIQSLSPRLPLRITRALLRGADYGILKHWNMTTERFLEEIAKDGGGDIKYVSRIGPRHIEVIRMAVKGLDMSARSGAISERTTEMLQQLQDGKHPLDVAQDFNVTRAYTYELCRRYHIQFKHRHAH